MSDAYRPITTGARLSLPLNGTIYTTVRQVPDEKPLPAVGSTMAAELGSAWADSVVIEANEVPNGTMKQQTIVHARIPAESAQLESNWEWSSCSIGGQRFDSIRRTVIIPSASFSRSTPALASAMPISSGTTGSDYQFNGLGHILVSRNAARSGMQLEPAFRVEVREYVKREVMVTVGVDGINGKPLRETVTLYHGTETVPGTGSPTNLTASVLFSAAQANNAFWGVQATGFENSGQQLSGEWYAITSSQVIAGTATTADGITTIAVSDSPSNDEFYWPPVLQLIEFMDWTKRAGGADIHPRVVFKREEYRGPCRTQTTRTWCSQAFTIPVCDQLLANGGHYGSPFFSVSLPACLHPQIALKCDIGNTDPDYLPNTGSMRIFLATNETDWPESIVAYDDQEPYRGGYLRTRKVVYSPDALTAGGGAVNITIPAPSDLAASNETDSGFDLDWTADSEATDYLVEVALDSGFTDHAVYRMVQTNSDEITGLAAETEYFARVTTLRGYMFSPPCAAVTVQTLP